MQDMKAIQNKWKGKEVSTCPVCGINTYGDKETEYNGQKIKGIPIVWPCGVSGPQPPGRKLKKDERAQCPWETEEQQRRINPDMKALFDGMKKGIDE